jgi:hypothetical protein
MDDPEHRPNPYQSVWQMSQVGGTEGGRRTSNLKIGTGIIAGLITLVPFALVTTVVWGWWGDSDADWNGGGWAILLVGLAAAFGVGGFAASESN